MVNQWLKIAKEISIKLDNADDLICPKCGNNEIDFQYVGDKATRVGYLDIWCKSCLHGIHISRTRIPANATMISFDEPKEEFIRRIPNFVQITP